MKRYLKMGKSQLCESANGQEAMEAVPQEKQMMERKTVKAEEKHTFYQKPWFWVCLTLIIFCITRPFVIVVSGNNSGNTDCGSGNSSNVGL